MLDIIPPLLSELRALIADLGGNGGGPITPSVYDTAQVLRFAPPKEGIAPAVTWLLAQQHPDGGWGDPAMPLARHLPTLAAVVALFSLRDSAVPGRAIESGLRFLRCQAHQWAAPLPDDIPIGVELLLPRLLEDAAVLGLDVPQAPYAELIALGQRRRQLIARMRPGPGSTPTYSWEAWGSIPDPALLDNSGGIGHNPAATAAWLHAASGRPDLSAACIRAERFLTRAAAATGTDIPGVVPTVWPYRYFELEFGLYALLLADLLQHPDLRDVVQPHLDELAQALPPNGTSFSEFFAANGDDTACTTAVLSAAGYQPDLAILLQFQVGDQFCTYPHELQPSLTATARAVHALGICGVDTAPAAAFLVNRQQRDGCWSGDKWNSSWLYATSHVILALLTARQCAPLYAAIHGLRGHQHPDGGWGRAHSTSIETAYAILALHQLQLHGLLAQTDRPMVAHAHAALQHDRPRTPVTRWIGKELYGLQRVDRMFELSALAVCAATAAPAIDRSARLLARHV